MLPLQDGTPEPVNRLPAWNRQAAARNDAGGSLTPAVRVLVVHPVAELPGPPDCWRGHGCQHGRGDQCPAVHEVLPAGHAGKGLADVGDELFGTPDVAEPRRRAGAADYLAGYRARRTGPDHRHRRNRKPPSPCDGRITSPSVPRRRTALHRPQRLWPPPASPPGHPDHTAATTTSPHPSPPARTATTTGRKHAPTQDKPGNQAPSRHPKTRRRVGDDDELGCCVLQVGADLVLQRGMQRHRGLISMTTDPSPARTDASTSASHAPAPANSIGTSGCTPSLPTRASRRR